MNLMEWLAMYVVVSGTLNALWYMTILGGYEPKKSRPLATGVAAVMNFGLAALAAFALLGI